MAESLTLTTPVTTAAVTDWHMTRIDLNRKESTILFVAESNTGQVKERLETGGVALTLYKQLHKADLSVKSLERRALEYMAGKGDFAGTVTGVPD